MFNFQKICLLNFSLLSSWLIFLIRETPKATVRRMKFFCTLEYQLINHTALILAFSTVQTRYRNCQRSILSTTVKVWPPNIRTTNEQQIKYWDMVTKVIWKFGSTLTLFSGKKENLPLCTNMYYTDHFACDWRRKIEIVSVHKLSIISNAKFHKV